MTEEYFRIRRGEHPDIIPMDHSRLEVYERCPAQFNFQYNLKLPRFSGEAAGLGTAGHDFMEIYLKHGINAAKAYVSLVLPLAKQREFAKIKEAITAIDFKGKPYATEQRFFFYAELGGKTVQFEAKIDVLFLYSDRAEIIDGKTGRQVPDSVEYDPQGFFYALACLRSDELAPFGITGVLFTQAQFQTGKLISAEFTKEMIEDYERVLLARVEKIIGDKSFKPRPGPHCNWCPYVASHCPVGASIAPQLVGIGSKDIPIRATTLEEAQALAEQAMYLDALLGRMKKALKGFMYWNGDFPIKTESGVVAIDIVYNKDFEGGVKGILERHPEEKDKLRETHYPRLVFKMKDK